MFTFQLPHQNIHSSIYPNPTTNFINIETNQIGEVVQIIDSQGKVLSLFQLNTSKQQHQVSNLPTGTYFVKIGNETRKLLITK